MHRACEQLTSWLDGAAAQKGKREPLYLLAVANYRLGKLQDARRWAEEALVIAPTCHQCAAILNACTDQLAEDALMAGVGVGIAGVLLGLGVALLAGGRPARR